MRERSGWSWRDASAENRAFWQAPCMEGIYYAQKWRGEESQTVLDLGCGLGRQSILFAQEGFRVTAMDASDEGISYVDAWARQEKLTIHTCKGDMHALPFADDAFDYVWAYQVISHTDMDGLRTVLKEIHRVLRPGGRVYLTLCSRAAKAYRNAPQADRLDENTVYKLEETGDRIRHVFVDEDDIQTLFADYALLNVRHVQLCASEDGRAGRAHYHVEAQVCKVAKRLDFSGVIGRAIDVVIDRPAGSAHPRDPALIYPINYGYIPGEIAGDGSEQDVYVLGVEEPRERIEGLRVIAVCHRYNDCEDKWIAAPEGMTFSQEEILRAIRFVEQYFDSILVMEPDRA